jgi:hypothetical protein
MKLAVLALSSIILMQCTTSASSLSPSSCPLWVQTYAEFHRNARGKESSKYLSLLCNGTHVDGGGSCPGAGAARVLPRGRHRWRRRWHVNGGADARAAGDRFRAVLFLFRLAAATERVLLVDWRTPVALTQYFEPATLDWRADQHALALESRLLGWSVHKDNAVG